MKDEFNPTQQDLINLEVKIDELKKNRAALINRKMNIQSKLSDLQAKYGEVEYMGSEFNEIKAKRKGFKEIASEIELEIRKANTEIKHKNTIKLEVQTHLKSKKEKTDSVRVVLQSLKSLRTKYNDFSKDRTWVSSMRVMASEFTDEIDTVLRHLKSYQ